MGRGESLVVFDRASWRVGHAMTTLVSQARGGVKLAVEEMTGHIQSLETFVVGMVADELTYGCWVR